MAPMIQRVPFAGDILEIPMKLMIQHMTEYPTMAAAYDAIPGIRALDGCVAARVIPAKRGMHGPSVQAFFPDDPNMADPLPNGMQRVMVPAGLFNAVTFRL